MWTCVLGDPAHRGAPLGQLPGRPRELGGPARPESVCAVQHRRPALHHGASGPGPAEEQHTGHGGQPAGLRHRPGEVRPLPAVSGGPQRPHRPHIQVPVSVGSPACCVCSRLFSRSCVNLQFVTRCVNIRSCLTVYFTPVAYMLTGLMKAPVALILICTRHMFGV